MIKSKNKELTFDEMEAQLFYAYQQRKCKHYCDLSLTNSNKIRTISLFIHGNNSEKTCFIDIFYSSGNNEKIKN
ncbi:MAG: hypothetical protein RSE19_08615, partial [Myroides sp.]